MLFGAYREKLFCEIKKILGDRTEESKAAIVTWCNNNGPTNYGQILQCFAMQKLLISIGIEPVTILYQNTPHIAPEEDLLRVQRFQKFINQYIKVSKPCLTREMIEDETADCDLLICGSDQIWNPIHYDPVYYLDFGRDTQKRLAISVSGIFNRGENEKRIYRKAAKYLNRFDGIYMREGHGAKVLSEFSDVPMDLMPDPTLLLSIDEWNLLFQDYDADKTTEEASYIFCYFLGNMDDYENEILEIKRQYRAEKVIYIPSNIVHHRIIPTMERACGIGPIEFLQLIKNARAVVTDSFHGVCISEVFHIPCYAADRMQKGGDVFGGKIRLNSLKEDFGIAFSWIEANSKERVSVIKEDILVSVIVPVYNAKNYLRESLNTICNQTYENIEIICVDDGSTDGSTELLEEYELRDKRIRVLRQENMHAGIARNNGFKLAKGKYVMFLDADDIFDSSLVEKMVHQAEKTSADFVICKSQGFEDETDRLLDITGASLNEEWLPDTDVFSWRDIPEKIYSLTAGWAWDKLYRTDFVKKNDLLFFNTTVAEDMPFVCIAYAAAEKISVVRECLVNHRINNSNSLEGRRNLWWKDAYDATAYLKRELIRRGLFIPIEKAYINWTINYLLYYLLGISDEAILKDFCDYYQKTGVDSYQFHSYPQDYIENQDAIEIFDHIKEGNIPGILCAVSTLLYKTEKDIKEHMLWIVKHQERLIKAKRWFFDRSLLLKKRRVIIYGYGDMGRDYTEQLYADKLGELVMVVDKYFKSSDRDEVVTHPIEDICKVEFDAILIAVLNRTLAGEIRKELCQFGIPEEKLFWFNPMTLQYE